MKQFVEERAESQQSAKHMGRVCNKRALARLWYQVAPVALERKSRWAYKREQHTDRAASCCPSRAGVILAHRKNRLKVLLACRRLSNSTLSLSRMAILSAGL
jgi:hypothetical protein